MAGADGDLVDGVREALWMVLLFTAQGDLVAARRLMRSDRGLKPAEVRAELAAGGAEMVGFPSEDLLGEFEQIAGGGSVATLRCPLWTSAGRSPLRLDVEVRVDDHSPSFVFLQLVDEQGRPLVTSDAVALVAAEAEPVADDDLRIPRERFVAPRPDLRVLLLADRVEEVVVDWAGRLDELGPHHRALMVIDRFVSAAYGGGLAAPYRDLPIDELGRRLVEATAFVGAPAFAALFRRIDEALPPEARASHARREAYLVDRLMVEEDTAWFDRFEEEFDTLDEGNALHAQLVAHIDANPAVFLR